MAFISRFNPKAGAADFWQEFRKPNPLRWPILAISTLPLAVILYWVSSETVYKTPESPSVTYITTFDPDRTEEEIIASNIANQEVKDLREARAAEIAERKRNLYKALGAAAGMDVEQMEAEADARRAAEKAAEEARRAELLGRDPEAGSKSDRENSNDGAAPASGDAS